MQELIPCRRVHPVEQHVVMTGKAERKDHSMYFVANLLNELYPYRNRQCDQKFKLEEKLCKQATHITTH